ncbi:MAG: hypothetical protein U0270_32850 [Labilithrix sp.]
MNKGGFRNGLALLVAVGAILELRAPARATDDDPAPARERCASRLSIAMLGKSATPELLASANPQGAVDAMTSDWAFIDRFSRFLNASFNDAPGDVNAADAPYFLATRILRDGKPYRELFTGKYIVVLPNPSSNNNAEVKDDPAGIGYFTSPFWEDRYAGNEENGVRLRKAYRILNNTIGLEVAASTADMRQDVKPDGNGRQNSSACRGCHFDSWFALDKVAGVLGDVRLDARGAPVTKQEFDKKQPHIQFKKPAGPQQILGKTIANDRELVETLVSSPDFAFNACRLSFKYLYGRAENQCEGDLFDRCVDAFTQDGMIQTAVATIAKDPSFCQ